MVLYSVYSFALFLRANAGEKLRTDISWAVKPDAGGDRTEKSENNPGPRLQYIERMIWACNEPFTRQMKLAHVIFVYLLWSAQKPKLVFSSKSLRFFIKFTANKAKPRSYIVLGITEQKVQVAKYAK